MPGWLILLFVATLALGTDEFVISGILPEVAADLGVTPGAAGLLVTAFAGAFCLGAPLIAVLTDRLDKRRILVCGLAVFALANAAMALVDVLAAGIALRIVAGLAAAAVSPTAMAIAGAAAPAGSEGRYLAVATAGLTVALFTGVPLGTLLSGLLSWRLTFVLIAIAAAVVALLAHFRAPRIPGNQHSDLATRLAPIRNGATLSLVLAMLLCGAGGLMFYTYLGTIITSELGGSAETVSGALLLVGTVGVAAILLGGALADARGPRTARLTVIGGHALALAALGAFLLNGGRLGIALFALIALWSVFAWALSPPMQTSIINLNPDHAMLALALAISGLYGGAALGAALGGALIDHFASGVLPLTGAALLALAWLAAALPRDAAPHGPAPERQQPPAAANRTRA